MDKVKKQPGVTCPWSGIGYRDCFRDDGDAEFIDDFSDMLLLKLFDLAIAGCHDNDKVKYNTVRALGSLLHYLPVRIIGEWRYSRPN